MLDIFDEFNKIWEQRKKFIVKNYLVVKYMHLKFSKNIVKIKMKTLLLKEYPIESSRHIKLFSSSRNVKSVIWCSHILWWKTLHNLSLISYPILRINETVWVENNSFVCVAQCKAYIAIMRQVSCVLITCCRCFAISTYLLC